MVRRPPSRFSILLVLALAAAFGVLTLGMLLWPPLQAFDERTTATRLDPNSATAQIAARTLSALLSAPQQPNHVAPVVDLASARRARS